LRKLVAYKIAKEAATKKAAETAKAKAKEAEDKKRAAEQLAREQKRKDTTEQASKLEKKRSEEQRKYLADMKKIQQQRNEQLEEATSAAKKIGEEVKSLEDIILATRSTIAKEQGHRREVAKADLVEYTATLKRKKGLFDQAREKLVSVRKLQEDARKATEEARIKCEACGEQKVAHMAAQEIAIAKAKAVELAQAKMDVPKDAQVLKVDDKNAESEIVKGGEEK